MTDLFSKFDPLIELRTNLLAQGQEDPFNLVMERVVSPTEAICNGRQTILLGTYNYMGMTFDPDVIEAGKQALDDFGAGTTGSRVLNGTYSGHKAVEEALKEFYGMHHAMVFSTGYQANLGIISTVAGKGDYIVLDIDSHASIWDGCKLGDAEVVPFKHNDIEAMDKRLGRIPEGAGKLVILEGVYSMLGDIAPLKEMIAVAKKHGAMVLVGSEFGTHGWVIVLEIGGLKVGRYTAVRMFTSTFTERSTSRIIARCSAFQIDGASRCSTIVAEARSRSMRA